MPPDPILAQCFWTYPNPSTAIPAGTPLSFQVVVPPAGGAIPVTGSAVSWTLTDGAGTALVAGRDYHVLGGDLASPLLAVVFAPKAMPVKVAPTVRLFYWNALTQAIVPVESNPVEQGQFTAQTYSLLAITEPRKQTLLATIMRALSLVADRTVIEPGEPALLELAPRSLADVPQVVTNVLDESPKVTIRGAIPLKGLVDAIVGPLTGGLGRVLPGSRTSLDNAGKDVARLLGQPIAIPLAIDVLGKRVTKTLAPLGDATAPVFTSDPTNTGTLTGLVPIGKWQVPFTVVPGPWSFGTTSFMDLSPGVGLVKSFLLKPEIVSLSTAADQAPTSTTAKLDFSIALDPTLGGGAPLPASLELPLRLVRLAVPRIAGVFNHAIQYGGRGYLCPDPESAPFMPSLDDALRLLSRLGTALNHVVAVANQLPASAVPTWQDVLDLATACGVLTDKCGRTAPEKLFYAPSWRYDEKIDIKDNIISEVIYLGQPGPVRLELEGNNESNVIRVHRTCVLPNLDGTFAGIIQLPSGAADATTNLNYTNELAAMYYRRAKKKG